MIFPSDPVERGLVASLARSGGNVTGTTLSPGQDMFGKRLQMLKEAVPRASRVAVLWNPEDAAFAVEMKEVEAAARSTRIRLQHVEARGPPEFESAFAAMARADAFLISGGSTYLVHRARIAELALKGRLPAISGARELVEAGLLMSYGVNMTDFVGRAALYVDKVLRGAKPADLPVEHPTKFELVINLKTAKALGLRIPQSLLLRADQTIE
jgi:putative ABC transport system substrate-binding protein